MAVFCFNIFKSVIYSFDGQAEFSAAIIVVFIALDLQKLF